jgi:hypothetical protein
MKMNKSKKNFDAVKMMREIRDKISLETQNMSFEQLKEYINAKLNQEKSTLIGESKNVLNNYKISEQKGPYKAK